LRECFSFVFFVCLRSGLSDWYKTCAVISLSSSQMNLWTEEDYSQRASWGLKVTGLLTSWICTQADSDYYQRSETLERGCSAPLFDTCVSKNIKLRDLRPAGHPDDHDECSDWLLSNHWLSDLSQLITAADEILSSVCYPFSSRACFNFIQSDGWAQISPENINMRLSQQAEFTSSYTNAQSVILLLY